MNNLKNSIAFLIFYLTIVYGVAQVRYIEDYVLNFSPVFFILLSLAVLVGIFIPTQLKISIYLYLFLWALLYALIWQMYWRVRDVPLNVQVLGIQFLLVEIAAGLSFDVGRQIGALSELFDGLSANTYPNRTLTLSVASDRISAELTRSRRYHHPLALLIVELQKGWKQEKKTRLEILQKDLLHRFAIAKVGQIISERARETDLIVRDDSGRFLVVCPETDYDSSVVFAGRIATAVGEHLGAGVVCSSASFPDEALTFDELLECAEQRLSPPVKSAPESTD